MGKAPARTLTERHRNATAQIEQRHRLDLQKTPDEQKLRMRHFNERAAFEDRKRIDRENLEQKGLVIGKKKW
jgi:hypothetical protein